ncbi:MAG TPA: hypothetical protein H9771_08950 [Candidatus Faecalibacterium faecipullorum]|uniref:DUF5655 domain-containing protein n=1 Tax=Candidatus Faecalibacterium faecipullorum TaxID=2838578 RepID=A0A9D2S8E0_9FIRM|nr:hypothetical protein [Candidatus Faecalibacterium faecipullorum]
MDFDTMAFFEAQKHPEALPLYEALEGRILAEVDSVRIKVQKSQITFYNRRLFACASFARVRRKAELPPCWLVVTVGLARRLDSPRVAVATEPYPGRWTHHIVISDPAEVDDELMGWVREAAAFAAAK